MVRAERYAGIPDYRGGELGRRAEAVLGRLEHALGTDGEFRENGVEQPDGPGGRVTGVENGTVQRGDAIVHVAERGVLARCERGDEGSGNLGGGGLRMLPRLRILLLRPDAGNAGTGNVAL